MSFAEAVSRALSGVAAGLVATTVMQPIDVAQKRLQVQDRRAVSRNERFRGLLDALVKTARQDGVSQLYSGLWLSYLSNVVKNSVFFSVYETARWWQGHRGDATGAQLGRGLMAGSVATMALLPVQAVAMMGAVHGLRPRHALAVLIRERGGVFGLWRGLGVGLMLSVYPALQHLIFNRLRRAYLARRKLKELPPPTAFLLGVVANLIALFVCYPLIVIKVRLQASRGSGAAPSVVQLARSIIERDGIAGLWQGLRSQLASACLSAAILFATKEHLQTLARRR